MSNDEFKSTRDMYEYLLDGGFVTTGFSNHIYALNDKGNLSRFTLTGKYDQELTFGCISGEDWKKAFPKDPDWFEEIPEQGIICWVSDYPIGAGKEILLDLVLYYADGFFRTRSADSWKYARPLTSTELLDRSLSFTEL
mgnify:CR=1 FL=1